MDEYNTGMDPEVRRYFRKIMATVGAGLLWFMVMATMGLYFKMGYFVNGLDAYNGVFYPVFLVSLAFLLRFLIRVWRKSDEA